MLFIRLTKDQKKVKRLEDDLARYQRDQAEVIQNMFEALQSSLKSVKSLYQRIVRLEQGEDFDPPSTLH